MLRDTPFWSEEEVRIRTKWSLNVRLLANVMSARVLFVAVLFIVLIRKGFKIKNLPNPKKTLMDHILRRLFATIAIALLCLYEGAYALAQPPSSRPSWMFPALGIEVIQPTKTYHPIPVPLRQQKAIPTLVKRPQSTDSIPIRAIPVLHRNSTKC